MPQRRPTRVRCFGCPVNFGGQSEAITKWKAEQRLEQRRLSWVKEEDSEEEEEEEEKDEEEEEDPPEPVPFLSEKEEEDPPEPVPFLSENFPLLDLVGDKEVLGDILLRLVSSYGSVRIRSICKGFNEKTDRVFRGDHHTNVADEIFEDPFADPVNEDLIKWLCALPQPPPSEYILFVCA
uniref:F-box domain-containing protein n=1 Tax=Chromera velia CCMP2878 TaxID=1169474 RepID=A0A0G4HIH2_9ALVE|eukprot:Cvel_7000.t1-p1 / transcript=Cvel_7000.t1 / gene=Cvel_7000 / organism=Chromera_velia_CCMP2878 / gene_product=hypothetical protein / transcript_product=hypothetical protein / location=Cvel_scaffold356:52783-53319(+) / protein_length=179 / sequence_SO=supercontig / SO=protein_coding / is_pseudo=false